MTRCIHDGAGCNLWLINWWNWLGLAREPTFHPAKLRCVEGGHLNHCDTHLATIMDQFAPARIAEPREGMLGREIAPLKRDATIGKGRADLNNQAVITWQHPS